eukprot:3850530-Alexandrium_andersonii.AAC.1
MGPAPGRSRRGCPPRFRRARHSWHAKRARKQTPGVDDRRAQELGAIGHLEGPGAVSYTHLRAHETSAHL